MKLSEHFTLEEMVFSQTAIRKGIKNVPGEAELNNLKKLCFNILEPFRNLVGPLRISSGYRCPKLNISIGGSKTSQHCLGKAADIIPYKFDLKKAYLKFIESDISYDQAIFEFGEWIHVSWTEKPRKQNLIAYKQNGKTAYKLFNEAYL